MDKVYTQQEKKRYIIKAWDRSSGEKIAEMLKRYFSSLPVSVPAVPDIIKTAQEIFK